MVFSPQGETALGVAFNIIHQHDHTCMDTVERSSVRKPLPEDLHQVVEPLLVSSKGRVAGEMVRAGIDGQPRSGIIGVLDIGLVRETAPTFFGYTDSDTNIIQLLFAIRTEHPCRIS